MAVTVVQSAIAGQRDVGTNPTVTLSTPATVGNLLVGVLWHRAGSASATPTMDGMTLHVVSHTTSDGGNKGVAILLKVSDGSEDTFTTSGGWQMAGVIEFDVGDAVFDDGRTYSSGATAVTSATVVVPDPLTVESLAFAAVMGRDVTSVTGYNNGYAVEIADYIFTSAQEATFAWREDATAFGDVTASFDDSHEAMMVSAVVTFASSWTISGTVTKDGALVADATVFVVDTASDLTAPNVERVVTDVNGDWSRDILGGRIAHAMGLWDDAGTLHTAEGRPFIEEPGA